MSIAAAPETDSSDGWPTSISVPLQALRLSAISLAVPYQAAMCRSWPQACATGTVSPAAFFVVTLLAKARLVFSWTGNASDAAMVWLEAYRDAAQDHCTSILKTQQRVRAETGIGAEGASHH